jgi:proton-dependent oligopeptide transporter, POT family
LSIADRIREMRTGFSRTFWVANILELFERFAFYGSKAVLTVYLANKVGLAEEAGSLAGFFSGMIFSLPIVAGVFVDRYGFRKTLMACFSIFCVGYFLIGMAGLQFGQAIVETVGKKPYVIGVLLLTAVGGSLIKPCIVGTVAKTSRPDVKSLGFSIYYTLVNFGGAVGPILALHVRENLGIEYVLIMSSITSFLLFLGAFFFFQEPEHHDGGTAAPATFAKVFRDMLLVFRNFRFISFLVIFSGFWIMFWQIFYSFPFYITEVLKFPRFEILETVDAWTIILVSVPVTALAKRLSPITAMTLGFVIASSSWVLLANSPTVPAAIAAMALFAIGESTQAPRFYEYVGSLAPRDQVGTFMGFAFLPVAIGSFAAGPIADWLRHTYLERTMNPSMMWYTLAAIGFLSTILMIGYNFLLARPAERQES